MVKKEFLDLCCISNSAQIYVKNSKIEIMNAVSVTSLIIQGSRSSHPIVALGSISMESRLPLDLKCEKFYI